MVNRQVENPLPVASLAGCPCGGGCPRCRPSTINPLAGLTRGHVSDDYERQARAIARDFTANLTDDRPLLLGPHRPPLTPTLSGMDEGRPLSSETRARLEPALGGDFSGVRMHTEPAADSTARQLQARAFTHGSHIYFRKDSYAPHTSSGLGLLAHELTHVVQQAGSPSTPSLQCDGPDIAPSGDHAFRRLPVTSRNHAILARDAGVFHHRYELQVSRYVIVTNRVYVHDTNGVQLGAFNLRPGFRPLSGAYAIGSHNGTIHDFSLGVRNGHPSVQSTGFSGEGESADFLHRLGDRNIIEFHDWTTVTPEQEQSIFTLPLLLLVAPPAPPPRPSPESTTPPETGGEESTTEAQAGGRPAEPADQPTFSPEFHDPHAQAGHPYDYPAFSAEIDGLDTQPTGGTGDFLMHLHYEEAGGTDLNQASWAFQTTHYRWELWKLRPELDPTTAAEGIRTGALSSGATADEGRTVGSGESVARDWERTGQALDDRPEEIRRDENEALREGRYIDAVANELNSSLYNLEVASRYATQILDTAGDLASDGRERRIPWSEPGTYVVRCIAAINPHTAPGEPARAPSVATKVVHVQSVAQISEEALDTTAENLDLLTAQLTLLTRLPASDPRRLQIPQLQEQIATLSIDADNGSLNLIEARLHSADSAATEAGQSSIFLRYGFGDDRVRALEHQRDQLRSQLAHGTERTRVLSGHESGAASRARATFVSSIDGQQYPLLWLMSQPYLDGDTWTCQLADITSADGDTFEGHATESDDESHRQEQKLRAAWEAVERFVHSAPYGPGSLSVRLPSTGTAETNWFLSVPESDRQRTLPVTNARDTFATRARLEELGQALALLGLVIAAPEIGLAGAALGAAISAERLLHRFNNGTLGLDGAAIGDVINILTAVTTGMQVVGSLERFAIQPGVQTLASGERVTMTAGFGVRAVRGAATAAHWAGMGLDYANLILANAQVAGEFADIATQERSGTLTPAQARRRRAHAFASAVQADGIFLASRIQAGQLESAREGPTGRTADTTPRVETEPSRTTRETTDSAAVRGEEGAPPRVTTDESSGRGVHPAEPISPRAPTAETQSTPRTPTDESSAGRPAESARPGAHADEPMLIEMPEATIMMPPDPHSIVEADHMYQNSFQQSPEREVAIYHNPDQNLYILVQGDNASVFILNPDGTHATPTAGRAQEWTTMLGGSDSGRWELLGHFHPNEPGTGAVHPGNRLPSGANGDFGGIIHESIFGGQQARQSRIDFNTPNGPDHTFFYFDPAAPRPYRVEYPDPATGRRATVEFDHLQDYHEWFRSQFGSDLGAVPDWIDHWESNRATTPPPPPEGGTTPRAPTSRGEGETAAPHPTTAPERTTTAPADSAEGTAPSSSGTATRPRRRIVVRPERPASTETATTPVTPEPPAQSTRRPSESESAFVDRATTAEQRAYWESLNGPAGRNAENPVRWARMQSEFQRLVSAMRNMQERLQRQGQGHLLPQVNDAALSMPLDHFIRQNPDLLAMRRAIETGIRERATQEGTRWSEAPQWRELQDFLHGSERMGSREVGGRRPDIVEFFLDDGRINISDVTTQELDPQSVHALKTRVYVEIMKAIVGASGPHVYGQDVEMHVDEATGRHLDPSRTRFGDVME